MALCNVRSGICQLHLAPRPTANRVCAKMALTTMRKKKMIAMMMVSTIECCHK